MEILVGMWSLNAVIDYGLVVTLIPSKVLFFLDGINGIDGISQIKSASIEKFFTLFLLHRF